MIIIKPFITNLLFIAVFASLLYFWSEILVLFGVPLTSSMGAVFRLYILAILTFAIGWFVAKLINRIFIDIILKIKLGRTPPQILKSMVGIIVFVITTFIVVGEVLDRDVAGIIAGSGVAVVVVGFGIRTLISDYSSSIVINLDKPYEIGDWVSVSERNVDKFYGFVEEITWRTTRIQTPDKGLVIVSNSKMGNMLVKNHTKKTKYMRLGVDLVIDSVRSIEDVKAILLSSLKSAPIINDPPLSRVLINQVNEIGVTYRIDYSFNPNDCGPAVARDIAYSHALLHLKCAGIKPAHSKHDVFFAEEKALPEVKATTNQEYIKLVNFFSVLEEDELALLAEDMTLLTFVEGDRLICQGEEGDSMYIIKSGVFDVLVEVETEVGSELTSVAKLVPGQVVGEMSLLTGAPRSASIKALADSSVFEITKEAMQKVIEKRPQVAEMISVMIAERELETAKAKSDFNEAYEMQNKQSFINDFTQKMKRFFNIS